MPRELGPRDLQTAVRVGFKRLSNFRAARLMFLRSFAGHYYDTTHGEIGTEPLNLTFNAIRILVPNIVMSNPTHHAKSNFVAHRDYAELLSLALDFNGKQLKLRDEYRRVIVDSLFTLGVLKTGLAASGSAIALDESDSVDPGVIYTECVDFDNFVFDPTLRDDLKNAEWMGDRVRVPRMYLLESGLYDNAVIERLPSVQSYNRSERGADLSTQRTSQAELGQYEDEVEIVEVWVRQAQALATVPAPATNDSGPELPEFLRIVDYDGPSDGPYTTLSLTPPVPGNPLPIALVGIWHDLHVSANRLVKKTLDQADRQKDVVFYRRSAADDAQEALDAADGEAIAVDDPDGIAPASFGGQNRGNEAMIAQLQMWFNMMAANPQAVGGLDLRADSATEANILQQNSSITLDDMNELVYQMAASEARKRAFYMHTDPLIELPLSRRAEVQTLMGPQMQEVQVFLTPEARRGDFLDYTIEIYPESMKRLSSAVKLQRAYEFAIKILPAAMQASQVAMMLGIPFNTRVFVENMARDAGIDWMGEVWYDPTFQQRMGVLMAMGPQMQGSKGQLGPALAQNGQPGQVGRVRTPSQEGRRESQMGAAEGQTELPVRESY